MRKSIMGLVIVLLCCASAFSQQAQRPADRVTRDHSRPLRVQFRPLQQRDHRHQRRGGRARCPRFRGVGKAEREAIANTIRQPVRFLVSSTFHNNYSKGNVAYADVWKIGHENYRTDLLQLMQREKVPAEEQKARLPNETYRDRRHALSRRQGDSGSLSGPRGTRAATASSMFRRIASPI